MWSLDFVTDNIGIGDGVEAEDEDLLFSLGITHVLNVHPMKMEYQKIYVKDKYVRIPWHDKGVESQTLTVDGKCDLNMLDQALDFMDQALKSGGKVLVICGAGFERAPMTVFAYLIKKRGLSIGEAIDIVKTKRPQTYMHIDWLKGWLKVTPEESLKYREFF